MTPLPPAPLAFDLGLFRAQVAFLADHGVLVGTSSWTYEGWLGQIYDRNRYQTRGKFSLTKFKQECLTEYAETFRTVCFDGGYYTFPSEETLKKYSDQVPDNFRFAFKVVDDITIRRFPNLPENKERAGTRNENFLDADLFTVKFIEPAEKILKSKLGPIIFQFSKMYATDYARGADFIADLDRFFARLPPGRPYSVELRNREWLVPEYLDCLRKHGVAHVFNNWTDMPSVGEQLPIVGDRRIEERTVARFLLKPGRSYKTAKASFEPYTATKEINAEARIALETLMKWGFVKRLRDGTYIYVNNRLEGNAINTIAAMAQQLVAAGIIPDLPKHLVRHLPPPDSAVENRTPQLELGL